MVFARQLFPSSAWSASLALLCVLASACSNGGGNPADETTGNAGPLDLACESDEPVLQPSGAQSGLFICNERFTHAVTDETCEVPDPPETCEAISGAPGTCSSSAECNEGPHGACLDDGIVDPSSSVGCRCVYSCASDDDCEPGRTCTCLGGRPRCLAGECGTDDDCAGLCVTTSVSGACGGTSYSLVCLNPDHECLPGFPSTCPLTEDCYGNMIPAPCEHSNEGWVCSEPLCGTSCG